jgi:hypothetical protein
MNTVKTDAARVAVLTALRDAIDTGLKTARVDTLTSLLEAYDALGVKSIDVRLPEGTKVGKITLTEAKAQVRLTDAEAFAAWAAELEPDPPVTSKLVLDVARLVADPDAVAWIQANCPDALLEEKQVDPYWRDDLLDRLVDAGNNNAAHPDTGQIVPGVTYTPARRPTQFSLRFDPTGRATVGDAWRAGQLAELGAPVPPAVTEKGA